MVKGTIKPHAVLENKANRVKKDANGAEVLGHDGRHKVRAEKRREDNGGDRQHIQPKGTNDGAMLMDGPFTVLVGKNDSHFN